MPIGFLAISCLEDLVIGFAVSYKLLVLICSAGVGLSCLVFSYEKLINTDLKPATLDYVGCSISILCAHIYSPLEPRNWYSINRPG